MRSFFIFDNNTKLAISSLRKPHLTTLPGHLQASKKPQTMSNKPANHAFQVDVPDHDLRFEVGPTQTIVEVAKEHGLEILTACEDGQCGTCVVKVLEGEADHRDRALKPEKREEGWMCACVSRAKGDFLSLEIW